MRSYKANMIPGGVTPTINVSQYDNDYAVTVTLIEGAEIYTPPVGATIRVEGTKPDGHGFEYSCTYQGNVVTMPIYTQMTVVAGRFPIELVVYQNGLRVGSRNIIFAVEKAPLGEDTDISETVIPDIIDAARASADAAAASAASAETAKTAAMDAAQDAIDAAQELQTAIQFNAALIHETASGSVASFADGADNIPMQSVVAEITPVQSGSGDPSPTNIRPISGRTGMTVTRAGRNLLPNNIQASTTSGVTFTIDNGRVIANGTATATIVLALSNSCALAPGDYVLTGCPAGGGTNDHFKIDIVRNGESLRRIDSGNGTTITVDTAGLYTARIVIYSGEVCNNLTFAPMVRLSGESADYVPYNGAEYPISWQTQAGTVYGGTLDVVSGVLTVKGVCHTLTGQESFSLATNSRRFQKAFSTLGWERANTLVSAQNQSNSRCSHAIYLTGATGTATPADYRISADPNLDYANAIVFYDSQSEFADAAAFNAYLAEQYANGTPVQLYYDLAQPQTYQLTPTEVRTLLGGNTIYTDAGDVSAEYIADTKLYIDNKIAELQALVLEN